MKAALAIVLVFVVQALAEHSFDAYKKKYEKKYSDAETKKAKAAYDENMARMAKHNKNPEASYMQGPNEHSDQSQQQRDQQAQPSNPSVDLKNLPPIKNKVKGLPTDLPKTLNYGNMLPAIMDQKRCKADYIISILAIYSYLSKKKTVYSAQDPIDCDSTNSGCSGGNIVNTMVYFQNYGLSDGKKYKWAAKNQTCQKKKFPSIVQVKEWTPRVAWMDGKKLDSEFMKLVLAQFGPVAVLINTRMPSNAFASYKSGIFIDDTCSKDSRKADSFVLLVGYGTDAKFGDFWIARNSYGTTWGEKGYFRIKRGNNTCGVENVILLPLK